MAGFWIDRCLYIYIYVFKWGIPNNGKQFGIQTFFFDDDLEKPGKSPFVRWFKGKIVILAKLHIAPVNNQEYQQ